MLTSLTFDIQASWLGWKKYLSYLDIKYWSDSIQYGNFTLNIIPFIYLIIKDKKLIGITACLIFGIPQLLNTLDINQINIILIYHLILCFVVMELVFLLFKTIKYH